MSADAPRSLTFLFRSLDRIGEMASTAIVELFLLAGALCCAGVAFFVWLNRRDRKLEERAYQGEFDPKHDLLQHIHRGESPDDRVDPRQALRQYRASPNSAASNTTGSNATDGKPASKMTEPPSSAGAACGGQPKSSQDAPPDPAPGTTVPSVKKPVESEC